MTQLTHFKCQLTANGDASVNREITTTIEDMTKCVDCSVGCIMDYFESILTLKGAGIALYFLLCTVFEQGSVVSSTQKNFRARDAVECCYVFLSAGKQSWSAQKQY